MGLAGLEKEDEETKRVASSRCRAFSEKPRVRRPRNCLVSLWSQVYPLVDESVHANLGQVCRVCVRHAYTLSEAWVCIPSGCALYRDDERNLEKRAGIIMARVVG